MLDDLRQNAANYVPLSPISFLARTASVHPERVAVRYGEKSQSYAELQDRCLRLASSLVREGIGRGDVVSVLAPNTPAHLEAHFGVPMAGAVLNSMNVRLDAATIGFMLGHAESRMLIADAEFAALAREAIETLGAEIPLVIIEDDAVPITIEDYQSYELLIEDGNPGFVPLHPYDEWDAIALNYTSGTTGDPKGVVYHHRGAYLNALANTLAWSLGKQPVYLWTLPMFHCNGWCFPWTITALGGTHVCLRRADPEIIVAAIGDAGITHLAGAPIILSRIVNLPEEVLRHVPPGLRMMVAGAPPPASVIAAADRMGLEVTQTYGLTEVYGPCVVCEWKNEWDQLPPDERARIKARQGVRYHLQEAVDVLDPLQMTPVPADGTTVGEIMIRGNIAMKGYLKNLDATAAAFEGGWFHTGDLAVKHMQGYVEIRDRSKDIIISGGENISTVEIEGVLMEHPAILDAAVVASPDETWGETPCAFITLKPDTTVTPEDVIAFCRIRMARFKVPKAVVFGPIPKTSTGKTQKFLLRARARELAEQSISADQR